VTALFQWVQTHIMRRFNAWVGLVSAGLAIALRDSIVNLAERSSRTWRRPFEVGDRIQIGEHAGARGHPQRRLYAAP
jgi:small-conductance mechanosensitive channel